MPDLLSPALILVAAAIAIGPARGHVRTAIVLLAPLLTLWAIWQVADGVPDTVRFLSYQIEPVEGSPLRRLFATVFALMAFVGGLYAYRLAMKVPGLSGLVDRHLIRKLGRLLDGYGHARFEINAADYKPASGTPESV